MSTADPPLSATGVGLSYGIAIAVSILGLISTIMLASYACMRIKISNIDRRSSGNGGINGANNYGLDRQPITSSSIQPMMTVVMGLDEPMLESYPKLVLGESRRLPRPNNSPCSICLSDYNPKDTIRCIPDCHHCFHADCVDEWLKMSATCPLCRNSPGPSKGPTPVTTPSSDWAPLSFRAR